MTSIQWQSIETTNSIYEQQQQRQLTDGRLIYSEKQAKKRKKSKGVEETQQNSFVGLNDWVFCE